MDRTKNSKIHRHAAVFGTLVGNQPDHRSLDPSSQTGASVAALVLRPVWRFVAAMVALVLWLGPWRAASAQQPLTLPRVEDGRGIKVGERSSFHPGVALSFGYDSNVFYEDRAEDPVQAGFMLATAWGAIANREVRDGVLMTPAQRTGRIMDYNLALVLGFRQFMDPREFLRDQSRFSIGAETRLAFLPGRTFSIELDDSLYRLSEPRNIQAGAAYNFNRIDHEGELRFILRPGGGKLTAMLGYVNEVLYFENTDFGISRSDRTVNGLFAETKWRFLPKSSLGARYSMRHTYYLSCCVEAGTGRNEDNFAHRVMGGYYGEIIKKIRLAAEFGWGFAFYRQDANGPNFNGPLAKLSFDYFPTMRTRLHISGERRFQDSLLGNYFVDLGGRLQIAHTWRWRMLTRLGAGVFQRKYHGLPEPGVEDQRVLRYTGLSGQLQRRDILAIVSARIEQPLAKYFALALDYNVQIDATDFAVTFANQPDEPNLGGFVRHVVMLMGAVRF